MVSATNLQPVAIKIRSLPKSDGHPTLIAISGFGGSGKTTIANKLASLLKSAYIVHIDDFILKENLSKASWEKESFDRDRLEKYILIPSKAGKPIRYQKFLWDENRLSDFEKIPTVNFLIVEGIAVYHPDIADYYDLCIWIDVDLETATKRGQIRDGSNENASIWDLWKENDKKYFEKYQPRDMADIIINNN